jgi:hypothetical protein
MNACKRFPVPVDSLQKENVLIDKREAANEAQEFRVLKEKWGFHGTPLTT